MLALTFQTSAARWLTCKALGLLTPNVYWSALSGLSLRDVPVPELPGPQWVRLRTRLGGICGTDLGLVFLRNHPASILRSFSRFPLILGHENVADVEAVGSDVAGWSVGQRVIVEPSLSCVPRGIDPPCPQCQAGRFCLCENFLSGPLDKGIMIGAHPATSGSWAPYFVAHQSQLHAVPDDVSDEQAVLVDPVAGGIHGILRRPPGDGERVLVLGGGIIGLSVVGGIQAVGCRARVTAVVRHPFQRAKMESYGADAVLVWPRSLSHAERYRQIADLVGGRHVSAGFGNQMLIGGFDLVYDCIGTGRSLTDAVKFARSRGTVVELGTSQICVVDTTPLWFSEVTVLGAYGRAMETWDGRPRHTYEIVLEWMRTGRLATDGLLTHTFALHEYRSAFRTLARRSATAVIKAAFTHETGIQD